MCQPIVTIISSNLLQLIFKNFPLLESLLNLQQKYITLTLPSTPKIWCRTTSKQLWHQNCVLADVTVVVVNMVFSDADKILIKNLYQLKGYKATELMNKFPNNGGQKVALTGC